jgi:hypothetical protein
MLKFNPTLAALVSVGWAASIAAQANHDAPVSGVFKEAVQKAAKRKSKLTREQQYQVWLAAEAKRERKQMKRLADAGISGENLL